MIEIKNELNYEKNTETKDFAINLDIVEIMEKKNILNITVTSQNRAYVLNIAYEDEEHTVIKEKFTILSKHIVQRTDINTPYIALANDGIYYYLPYRGTDEAE